MIENKFTRYVPGVHDPTDRCGGPGPCPYLKISPSEYCWRHGANKKFQALEEQELKNYRLDKWRGKVASKAYSSEVKSLREEIGILRMILEEMLNRCSDADELLLYSHRISDFIIKIEKLVTSCDRLEGRMGLLLNKSSIISLAAQCLEIINNHIENPDTIETISAEMADTILKLEVVNE